LIFRGQPHQAYGGWSVNIPQRSFKNNSDKPARLLCMCAPSGQEKFFVPAGDARPPKLSKAEQAERRTTAKALSPSIEPGRRYEGPGLVSCAPRVIRSEDDSPIQLRFIEGGLTIDHTAGERACEYQAGWCGRRHTQHFDGVL
jgi:hypothetical protein